LVLEQDSETCMNLFGDFPGGFRIVVLNECGREFGKFAVSPGVLGSAATMSADGAVASSLSGDDGFTAFLESILLFFECENTYLGKSGIGGGGGGGVVDGGD